MTRQLGFSSGTEFQNNSLKLLLWTAPGSGLFWLISTCVIVVQRTQTDALHKSIKKFDRKVHASFWAPNLIVTWIRLGRVFVPAFVNLSRVIGEQPRIIVAVIKIVQPKVGVQNALRTGWGIICSEGKEIESGAGHKSSAYILYHPICFSDKKLYARSTLLEETALVQNFVALHKSFAVQFNC